MTIRAIKLKLYATKKKQRIITNIIIQYKKAVNFYIKQLFTVGGKLDAQTLALLTKTNLTERYKSNALKQALEIHSSCINKKVQTHKKIPKFTGNPVLDSKFVNLEDNETSKVFDFCLRLSTFTKGKRITIPTKKTSMLHKWLNQDYTLIQGCELHVDKIIVWVKSKDHNKHKPDFVDYKKEGEVLGIDLGMIKLITTSDEQYLGRDFKKHVNNIYKKRKNSKGYKRALKELDNYIDSVINQIDFSKLRALGYEDLTGITKGKKGLRKNGRFRKAQQHWCHGRIITRLIEKCEENRVRPVYVNPKDTSRTCTECGHVVKENRKGENFVCLRCSHTSDADLIGAKNILVRTLRYLGSVESPIAKKV